ncbi:MAG: hypothetical protein ACRDAI_02915 [Candidatus Rhabdochlamydia sp.]
MQIETLSLTGIRLIKPQRFFDQRGFFSEVFHKQSYKNSRISCESSQRLRFNDTWKDFQKRSFQALERATRGVFYRWSHDLNPY